MHTTDGGATWTAQVSSVPETLYRVYFSDHQNGVAVGDLGIVRTTNGGATWTRQVSRTARPLRGVHFIDANTGAVVGDFGTILHTTTAGEVATSVTPLPISPKLLTIEQNYPNPFAASTAIPFVVSRGGHVSLSVYDLLGREVAMLVDGVLPAGRHSVTWNAAGLASGVYLGRIDSGIERRGIRMVLMR